MTSLVRLPPSYLSDPALIAVMDALPEARVVGGAVRDAIAGLPTADIDLATPDRPDAVAAALARAGLRAIPTGIGHGTITALSGGRGFEVTTLRRDEATDGRHATVAFTGDWREDAARRDFTINAMSMARDGAVFDYFGGGDDLAAGRVRFVGDAATRVREDFLRILRYFRFHARYGRGEPDEDAITAIRDGVPGLAILSAERVWSEISRILIAPDPAASLAIMAETGVLAAILPEAYGHSDGFRPSYVGWVKPIAVPPDPILRLAALTRAPDAEAVAIRWKLSGAERERLAALLAAPPPPEDADDDALRRALADTDKAVLTGRAWLAGSSQHLRDRLAAMPTPAFPLEGRDALALGVPPGPRVGALLRSVRAWWLERGCRPDAAACRAELGRLAAG